MSHLTSQKGGDTMSVIYYDVLEPGVGFVSPYRTFVFSENSDKLEAGSDNYTMIQGLLHSINCEPLMDNYHEMDVSEALIVETLRSNNIVPIKVVNIGRCRECA